MADQDEHSQIDRRNFLTAASSALVGSTLLAAGLPSPAQAAPATPRATGASWSDFKTGEIQANGLKFAYVEVGEGPLALCLHGWPDSPYSYRYLMPALAQAGYRAVAPYMRGYHPTAIPKETTNTTTLAADVAGLRQAFKGDRDSVLIAHDWGSVAAYGGAAKEPDGWRRVVIMNIPPLAYWAKVMFTYPQLKREFYWWFHQMAISDVIIPMNNFEYIDGIWADWSPGYDASDDLVKAKDCMRPPGHLQATVGYYRTFFDPKKFGTPESAAEQAAAWGQALPQRVLYLHGNHDGLVPLTDEKLHNEVRPLIGPNAEAVMVSGVGHFMLVENPAAVNRYILEFIKS
jgi:pimeloyl-ACP methyl ester carboxylesterase